LPSRFFPTEHNVNTKQEFTVYSRKTVSYVITSAVNLREDLRDKSCFRKEYTLIQHKTYQDYNGIY